MAEDTFTFVHLAKPKTVTDLCLKTKAAVFLSLK